MPLSFVIYTNSLPNSNFFEHTKFKASADDNLNAAKMVRNFATTVREKLFENIVVEREIIILAATVFPFLLFKFSRVWEIKQIYQNLVLKYCSFVWFIVSLEYLFLMALKKKALENTVRTGENAGNQHFLLFAQCFQHYQRQKSSF